MRERTPRALPPRVLALSPGDLGGASGGERGARAVQAFLSALCGAVEAGLRGVLLREPELSDRDLERLARDAASILRPRAGWLAIHDRVHLARALESDGVHLGFRSLPAPEARGLLLPHQTLGLSAHAGDDRRAWDAADYLFFGPLHDTPSKRGLVEPVEVGGLAAAVASTTVPVWAIGGIGPGEIAAALAAGARGVAVRAALFGERDPVAAWRRFEAALAATSSVRDPGSGRR